MLTSTSVMVTSLPSGITSLRYLYNKGAHTSHITACDDHTLIPAEVYSVTFIFLFHDQCGSLCSCFVQVRATPGHTAGCMTFVLHQINLSIPTSLPSQPDSKDSAAHVCALVIPAASTIRQSWQSHEDSVPLAAFTGDALLIRGCGRTDFQGGMHDNCTAQSTHRQESCCNAPSILILALLSPEDPHPLKRFRGV